MKFALVGKRISHSLSPKIHMLLFQKHNIHAEYVLLQVENTAEVRGRLLRGEYQGCNVTIPYKSSFQDICLSREAAQMEAVNVLKIQHGNLYGYNTDGFGFLHALKSAGISSNIQRASILGTGGAARAAGISLKNNGISVRYYSRSKYDNREVFPYDALYLDDAPLLVNATPLGMPPYAAQLPVSEAILSRRSYIMDMSYSLQKTALQKFCQEHGIICADGLRMLIAQAVKSQMIWLDRDYPVEEDIDYVWTSLGRAE